MTEPANLLIIMSDEHSREVLGAYGNGRVATPHIDRLAARGTLFTNAYTTCPICVPARASFATGRFVHEIGNWDNGTPYEGRPPSWAHRLSASGHRVESIGKLHYRDEQADTGFSRQHVPMHVVNGVGDILGCVREPLPPRWKTREMAEKIGAGETSYVRYDRTIRDEAVSWLEARAVDASSGSAKPWTCFVSMVTPHFPLIAPREYFDRYADMGIMPTKPVPSPDREHPWHAAQRKCFLYDNFTPEKVRIALASYYGLVSFMDDNVGRILAALDATGLAASTRVIYVSDHGENGGERGQWGKSNLYEEAAGIPAIIAGPGVPSGRVCSTPVSLVDIQATVFDCVGLPPEESSRGKSWAELASSPDEPERAVLSEYHAAGAMTGAFMIRRGKWKYMYYPGLPPQLFDLAADPAEATDLGGDARYGDVRASLHAELTRICDPDEVDRRAKRDQAAKVEAHGGRDAVVKKGGFGHTPPPGDKPQYTGTQS